MELSEIRQKLDEIDKELVLLLSKRMALIPAVAEYKKKNNLPRYQPEREKQVIDSKRKIALENNLNPDLIEKIYREIINDAHRIEEGIMGK